MIDFDDDEYQVTEDELYADLEIPESNWQLDGPLNLPGMGMAEVYELDGDEDFPVTETTNRFLADYTPEFCDQMRELGYVCNSKTGEWE